MTASILIVDDEAAIRTSLSRHYRLQGYNVDTAENGRAALENLAVTPRQVVISDIMMPEMNGIELLRRIRREYPMTRVIIITGYVTLENALACLRNNADNLYLQTTGRSYGTGQCGVCSCCIPGPLEAKTGGS